MRAVNTIYVAQVRERKGPRSLVRRRAFWSRNEAIDWTKRWAGKDGTSVKVLAVILDER